jgi:hypothetical protein
MIAHKLLHGNEEHGRLHGSYLLCKVMTVEEFPASLFLWPVQPLSEFTPANGVNKRFELLIGQIRAESFELLRYLCSNSGEFYRKRWAL